MKNIISYGVILLFVLIVNISIISFDMIYPEQPILYTVNSAIHSLSDLFSIYSRPKMLDIYYIPFFRPSGHFLMYQLIMSFVSWHNTKILLIINLAFLALTGFMMIKLYDLLFPRYKIGGYIAFSIYLMHPALILSRLIVMHFEFAYTLFSVLCIYFFVLFYQTKYQRISLLVYSLMSYAIAVTFKEPAIMLGAAVLCYFCITSYKQGYPLALLTKIFILLAVSSITFGLYLTLQWPTLSHPLINTINHYSKIAGVIELFKNIPGISYHFSSQNSLASSSIIWRNAVFPIISRLILYILLSLSLFSSILLYKNKDSDNTYKKSVMFLFISCLLFLVLPAIWGMAFPWHLSLTILFLSLIIGFSCEYLCQKILPSQNWIYLICGCLAILIGSTTYIVNTANLKLISKQQGFSISLIRNALLHPPAIQNQLNDKSVIVVEDNTLHDSYLLGSKFDSSLLKGNLNFDYLSKIQSLSIVKLESIYNGTLFRWAYLMPSLSEQIFQFNADNMRNVSNTILYSWLQHVDNIFCIGYDQQARWHDKTILFKKNLNLEKEKRHLIVNTYNIFPAVKLIGNVIYTKSLAIPDFQLCQYQCDQDKSCGGFTYIRATINSHPIIGCTFYDSASTNTTHFCPLCSTFIKTS